MGDIIFDYITAAHDTICEEEECINDVYFSFNSYSKIYSDDNVEEDFSDKKGINNCSLEKSSPDEVSEQIQHLLHFRELDEPQRPTVESIAYAMLNIVYLSNENVPILNVCCSPYGDIMIELKNNSILIEIEFLKSGEQIFTVYQNNFIIYEEAFKYPSIKTIKDFLLSN